MNYLVVLAGIALLILVHEFGHWIVARMFGLRTPTFSIGFGKPALRLFRFWDTDFQVTPWLLGGYVEIPELADESTVKQYLESRGEPPETRYIPIWQRTLVACAGVVMNWLTAFAIVFLLFAGYGLPNPQVTDVFVSQLASNVPIAAQAGVQANDVIVAVDGQPVKVPQDVSKQIATHKGTGTPVELTLQRGNQTVTVKVTPDADGHIGIMIGAHQVMHFKKLGIGRSAVASAKFVYMETGEILKGLGMLLHIVPAPKNLPPGATDVHGIVGIAQVGASLLQSGIFQFGIFLALMSIQLAVLNILPIPILDGGYVLFFAIEAVTGKPVNTQLRGMLMLICLMLLLGLMFLGLFNDIFHPIK